LTKKSQFFFGIGGTIEKEVESYDPPRLKRGSESSEIASSRVQLWSWRDDFFATQKNTGSQAWSKLLYNENTCPCIGTECISSLQHDNLYLGFEPS